MQHRIERFSRDERFEDDLHAERVAIEDERTIHVGHPDDQVTERDVGEDGHDGSARCGAGRPANSGRSRYVLMPGPAAQTSGMALTQWFAVATTPGFRLRSEERRVGKEGGVRGGGD